MKRRGILIGMFFALKSACADVELSFDTLFPETPVKQLYDTVIQLCADIAVLHDDTVSMQTKKDITDLVIGQLVRIRYLLDHMQHAAQHALLKDDVRYLTTIMNGLSSRFNHFLVQEQIHPLWNAVIDAFHVLRIT